MKSSLVRFGEHFPKIEELLLEIVHRNSHKIASNELHAIVDTYADHRERRNEFWSVSGQIILAIFIVIILAILLISKTISAEAGLPILSAVSGFAIAKGVNSSKGVNSPLNPGDDERIHDDERIQR